MSSRDELHGLALLLPCTYCGATAGRPCVVSGSERSALHPHAERLRILREAFWVGYEHGWDDRAESLRRQATS